MLSVLWSFISSKFGASAVALTVVIVAAVVLIRSYGSDREEVGYRQGAADSTAVWSMRYARLERAKLQTDSALTVERHKPPVIRFAAVDTGRIIGPYRSQIVAAFLAGVEHSRDSMANAYAAMSAIATLDIDTVQYVDSMAVRTQGQILFDPPSRTWGGWLEPSPVVTRTWLVSRGYIVDNPAVVIRNDWSAEIMLGSPVKVPALRVSPSLWYRSYGAGVDFELRYSPVWKIGGRFNF